MMIGRTASSWEYSAWSSMMNGKSRGGILVQMPVRSMLNWRRKRLKPDIGTVHVALIPGWAVRSKSVVGPSGYFHECNDINLSVHGVCTVSPQPSSNSRIHRTMLSIARRFAALPSPSCDDRRWHSTRYASNNESTPKHATSSQSTITKDSSKLSVAHLELEKRLQPFLAKSIPSQPVLLQVFLLAENCQGDGQLVYHQKCIANNIGHFQARFRIPGTSLNAVARHVSRRRQDHQDARYLRIICIPEDDFQRISYLEDEDQMHCGDMSSTCHGTQSVVRVSEPRGVRVLSDIDDTIKHSDLLSGPREVFRNVFCRPVQELAVDGMNSLFQDLAQAGSQGFHYVLSASIIDFLHVNRFPPDYSLNLKSYAGNSFFSTLFDGPANRKRENVLEVIDSFPDSQFLLFGDSAEQDLELYSSIAQCRPRQILAIFIRDITSDRTDVARSTTFDERSQDFPDGTPFSARSGHPNVLSKRRQSAGLDSRSQVQGLRDLNAVQQKVLERARSWEGRVQIARGLVGRTPLIFFTDPTEIQNTAVAFVQHSRGLHTDE